MSMSHKIDHILNQEYEIAASLSELDLMLRQLSLKMHHYQTLRRRPMPGQSQIAWELL